MVIGRVGTNSKTQDSLCNGVPTCQIKKNECIYDFDLLSLNITGLETFIVRYALRTGC